MADTPCDCHCVSRQLNRKILTWIFTFIVVVALVLILCFSLPFATAPDAEDRQVKERGAIERVVPVPAYLQATKLYDDVTKYTDLGPLSHRTGSLQLSRSMDWMQDRLKGAGATFVKREPVLQIDNAFVYNNDCNLTLKSVCAAGGKLLCMKQRAQNIVINYVVLILYSARSAATNLQSMQLHTDLSCGSMSPKCFPVWTFSEEALSRSVINVKTAHAPRNLAGRALVVEMGSIFLDPHTQSAVEVHFDEGTERIPHRDFLPHQHQEWK